MCECVHAQSLSHVQFFAAQWTAACQALLSMRFLRQEYWNGLPFPSPGISSTQGQNPSRLCLLQGQVGSLPLAPPGKVPQAMEPLGPSTTTTEPVFWSLGTATSEPVCGNPQACMPRAHVGQEGKPLHQEACTLQIQSAPTRHSQKKPARSNKDPARPNNKLIKLKKTCKLTLE